MAFPISLLELSSAIRTRAMEAIDASKFNLPILFYLQTRGTVETRVAGSGYETNVYLRKRQFRPDTDPHGTATFTAQDPYRTARIDWVSGSLTDAIGRRVKERNQNEHPGKVIDLMTDIKNRHIENFKASFPRFIYMNGNTAPNTPGGWETALAAHASSTLDGGRLRAPNGTYATLSTALGGIGGSYANFPLGQLSVDAEEAAAWVPLLVDETAASVWGSGTPSWATKADVLIRYACAAQGNLMVVPDLVITTPARCLALDDLFNAMGIQRIAIDATPREGQALGFKVKNYNGVDVVADAACNQNTTYIINFQQHLHYKSIYDNLTMIDDLEAVPGGSGFIQRQDYHGNFWFVPRGLVKIYPYT